MRRGPLDAAHRALGARMVGFGGWEMPVAYADGTIAEHLACREDAVVFDVSHLGTVRLDAPGAFDRLQDVLTSDLARIAPGRTQYAHLLEESGGVADDVIVWWVAPDRFDVMPNASNTARGVAALGGRDVRDARAVLAGQGPRARARLATVAPDAAAVPRRGVASARVAGVDVLVAGTGYTGEDGVELAVPIAGAGGVWDALLAAGIRPAGLGARDTLRLEAGLPLHGHELGPDISPLEAGLDWVVAWHKPRFRGHEALRAARARGVTRRLRGIATEGRRPPRDGCDVRIAGATSGRTTSGNFSPVLGHGIALAMLPPGVADGTEVEVDVRGAALAGRVVPTPFVSPRPRTR
ncbi:MAG: glycine cleavage system aminomethyltransferase GcvT [Ilumatobacteraceae bacterium]